MYSASKLFRDAVHDYISVPETYCRRFIDTQEFQRLRYIEQTSMRVLFPSARHDRFIHSLGTYHLGSLSFSAIKNSYSMQKSLSDSDWEYLKKTFEIACLLHDVAHAPFSHTLEGFFERTKTKITELIKKLSQQERIQDACLYDDLSAQIKEQCPKEHEMASACLVLSRYYDDISACDASPELAARMITGCKYIGTGGEEFKRMANVFISLLNGTAIDVDKLDYILRDTWASGVSNVRPDIQRLISSMRIHEGTQGNKHLAFHKSGLSAIQQVFDARSHLYRWIFSHHKVVYGCELINKSFDAMFSSNSGNYKFKSNMDLSNYCEKGKGDFNLPSDNEVLSAMRERRGDLPYAKEWFSREHVRIPLWKSYAEFRANVMPLFGDKTVMEITKCFRKYISETLNDYSERKTEPWTLGADASCQPMDAKKIKIFFGDKSPSYSEIFEGTAGAHHEANFFYVFVANDVSKENRSEIIRKIASKA